jgi:hypothetical protein
VKAFIDEGFAEIPQSNSLYLVKKSLRKLLRYTNKYVRYTGSKTIEIQLLLYYLLKLKESGIPVDKSVQLTNLYAGQLKKITKLLPALHEDLQYDYAREIELLKEF